MTPKQIRKLAAKLIKHSMYCIWHRKHGHYIDNPGCTCGADDLIREIDRLLDKEGNDERREG